ncbi:formate dehydrogenase accessory sulfurtransferase FdhD [Beggiatoa leptomitoformis]|uniref:Sulfur carrier protein FdhD n=1 Tax=Beggiatoa leptomitoformis TaxID=288004 RepID=A0A650GDU6_9GAMM|nr:formate dehydrogenase accessory sulfurtransferase FdhD [Beggiatoa leptomitoformis]ALG68070.1 formate dehydrogenase accessory sulfurtransferase FdhD [Beggiatoa leptomitoformis]QGX04091.1 formate dehydrogenase accessory sulfurtransferase FdhD [Beggiatoa leptomitoformis]
MQSYTLHPVDRWREKQHDTLSDTIAEETPIAFFYNGSPYVVMLATPQDLADFALGFSLSERIIYQAEELKDLYLLPQTDGIEIHVEIPQARYAELTDKQRNLTANTSCGLCGTKTLLQVIRHPAPIGIGCTITDTNLQIALNQLKQHQPLNLLTGAIHAAAWVSVTGDILLLKEDVGRHNALDKLIGAIIKNQIDINQGFLLITSRASYEMVQKAAMVGMSIIVAISAPTALAVRLAEESQITLIGFARGTNHIIYTHAQRLIHTTTEENYANG